ncbi:MAG: hypothetical protein R3E01_29450 [Pirellulaceae bacterium]|nr:hypothetical protein [Planctomycetales bacterium]
MNRMTQLPKTWYDRWLPGRMDSVLSWYAAWCTLAICGGRVAHWSEHFSQNGPTILFVQIALYSALAVPLLSWLVFGTAGFQRRWWIVNVLLCVPNSFLIYGLLHPPIRPNRHQDISLDHPWYVYVLFASACQLAALAIVAAVSLAIRPLSRQRCVALPIRFLAQTAKAGIFDLMSCTFFVGAGIALLRYLLTEYDPLDDAPLQLYALHIGLASSAFVLITLPALIAWQLLQRLGIPLFCFTISVVLILFSLGLLLAIALDGDLSFYEGLLAAGTASCVYTVFASLCLGIGHRWGLVWMQLSRTDRNMPARAEATAATRAWSWRFTFAVATAIASIMVFAKFVDVTVLAIFPWGHKWHWAARVATISREFGKPTNYDAGTIVWCNNRDSDGSYETIGLAMNHGAGGPDIHVSMEHASPEALAAVFEGQRHASRVWLDVDNADQLSALFSVQRIDELNLNLTGFVERSQLDELVRQVDIDKLKITTHTTVAEQIRQLQGLRVIDSLSIKTAMTMSAEEIQSFATLPIGELSVTYECPDRVDFRNYTRTNWILIKGSPVTNDIMTSLLDIPVLSPLKERSVCFQDCDFTEAAFALLLTADRHEYYLDHCHIDGTPPPPTVLLELADNPRVDPPSIQCESPLDEAVFLIRFDRRRARATTEVNGDSNSYRGHSYHVPTYSHDWVACYADRFGVGDGLRRISHATSFNEHCEITALDLEGTCIGVDGIEILFSQHELRHLRLGGPYDDDATFWLHASHLLQLESLEIPAYPLDQTRFTAICGMKQLKRLQLPLLGFARHLGYFVPADLRFPAPPRDEMGNAWCDYLQSPNVVQRPGYGLNDGYRDGTRQDFDLNLLSGFNVLEFLVLPEGTLTADNVRTIASLPRLAELHAPFTYVNRGIVESLAEAPSLKRLTIAVRSPDDRLLDAIASLRKLTYLQLQVMDSTCADSDQQQATLRDWFKEQMPGCSCELEFFPSPGG